MSAVKLPKDRDWSDYPIGTKAHSCGGGWWIRVRGGWKWCTGDTFPGPGGDACGNCVELPEPPALQYDDASSEAAHEEWKASCGHHSIAAACGVTLDTVRGAVGHEKGWMSPTNIGQSLQRLSVPVTLTQGMKTKQLREGVCRVQFEGKWLKPGVPARVAYFRTHYIAYRAGYVMDTALISWAWIDEARWRRLINFYANESPLEGWHITHWWEMPPLELTRGQSEPHHPRSHEGR